jgi:hypothetical protein
LRLSLAADELWPSIRIRPLCSQDPAVAPALEIDDDIEAVFGFDKAKATAIAATCWPVIPEAEDAGVLTEAALGADAAGCAAAGDVSRSSRLRPLIDSASNASTAKTMPMPTRLNNSPSFSKS